MLRTTLAGLRLHKGRLVTTALAIALGVMFVAGTLVFTDTLRESFKSQVMGSASEMDAIVQAAPAAPDSDGEGKLTTETLGGITDLPEVADADGVIKGETPLLDKDGRAIGQSPTLGISVGDITRYSAAEGSLPSGSGEAALATTTADTAGYQVGDTITVLDSEGNEHDFTVSGLVDFGVDQEIAYRGAVVFAPETTVEMTGTDVFTEINVIAAEGTPAQSAADAVATAVPDDAEVATGQEYGEKLAESAGTQADVMAVALLLFALISVFVASIVIYNTFAILIAQRQREMALLRCVGAKRSQVFSSVLLEALIVGLVSSAIGVLAGIGIGLAGFTVGQELLEVDTGSTTLVVSPAAVIIGLLVGTVMTVFAALLPALKATRVPPLTALRTSAVASALEKGIGWVRASIAFVFFLAAAGMITLVLNGDLNGQQEMYIAAGAAMVAFIGVVVISPLLVRAVVTVAGVPMRKFGVPSMLAADNARRSPKRAATAMIALTVGAMLITGYSVLSASVQTTTTEMLEEQFPVDYQLRQQFSDAEEQQRIPESVAQDLDEAPELGQVFTQRQARVSRDGGPAYPSVYAYFGAEVEDLDSDVASGDLSEVGPGKIAISEGFAADGQEAGDTVTVETEEGERSYEIAAVVPTQGWLNGLTLAPSDFTSAFPSVENDSMVYVRIAEGASEAGARDAVADAVADHPTVQIQSMAQTRGQFTQVLDTAYMAIAAMLGLAVLIAVFGIANTMALSVLERTRESALLRAVGLTGGQLRRMLSLEAVLLCLIGAGTGIALGVLFGWVGGKAAMSDLVFTLPTGQIALFIAVAIAAGLVASVLPARTAAKTSITGALASE